MRPLLPFGRVGDHVVLLDRRGLGVDHDVERHRACLRLAVELLADVVGQHRRRDRRALVGGDEGRILAIRAAVVEDQRGDCARVLGVLELVHERAEAALDQCDLAAGAGEVRRVAAADRRAGTAWRRHHGVARDEDLTGHVTTGRELGHDVVGVLDPGIGGGAHACERRRSELLPVGEVERVERHAVARALEALLDVGPSVVAGRRRRAGALVGDRDACSAARARGSRRRSPLAQLAELTLSIARPRRKAARRQCGDAPIELSSPFLPCVVVVWWVPGARGDLPELRSAPTRPRDGRNAPVPSPQDARVLGSLLAGGHPEDPDRRPAGDRVVGGAPAAGPRGRSQDERAADRGTIRTRAARPAAAAASRPARRSSARPRPTACA